MVALIYFGELVWRITENGGIRKFPWKIKIEKKMENDNIGARRV